MDVVTIVVKQVAKMGEFSELSIRDCVSRMFDNGKQYDNPAAVVKELRAEVS